MDHDALWRAVCDDPEDEATALVYADWLEENGDAAQQDRAAFIRAQRALEKTEYDDPRLGSLQKEVARLLRKHGKRWLAGIPAELHKDIEFKGGLPRAVKLPATALILHGAAFFSQSISQLTITGTTSQRGAKALGEADWMGRVRLLRLQSSIKYPELLASLLSNPHLDRVRELEAINCALDGSMDVLAAWPGLASVRRLRLPHNELTARELGMLLDSPHLGPLEELTLTGNRLDNEAAKLLADHDELKSLRVLWLHSNRIDPAGARALADSPHLEGLERLSLAWNAIKDEEALRGMFPKVRHLQV